MSRLLLVLTAVFSTVAVISAMGYYKKYDGKEYDYKKEDEYGGGYDMDKYGGGYKKEEYGGGYDMDKYGGGYKKEGYGGGYKKEGYGGGYKKEGYGGGYKKEGYGGGYKKDYGKPELKAFIIKETHYVKKMKHEPTIMWVPVIHHHSSHDDHSYHY